MAEQKFNFNGPNAVADLKKGFDKIDPKWFFTRPEGRINRKVYIFYYFLPALGANIVLAILSLVLSQTIPLLAPIVNIASLVIALAGIMPAVKRLHDFNKPGPLYILALIPIANLVLVIMLLAAKGTAGQNQYGEDPLKA
jgi:uncharacterized membrane protein YhaH (DUF805 family)